MHRQGPNQSRSTVLTRLARNQAGNTLAMAAAAIVPMIGLIGGGVDAARLYAVKARLQSACDAGSLAGRRVMGTGQWSANSGRANTVALNTFDLNFESGSFGAENRTRSFSESDGVVTGTASAQVPMTLMRLVDAPTKTVSVTCEAQMRIPNTDVMFVLDNSGSMNQTIPGDSSGITKMNGLKIAIKCFYEALSKTNIDDVTAAQCGKATDPTGGVSTQVQLRFGFVNYDHMVNVGKLLPNDYLVDSATYQSRGDPVYTTVQAWTLGTASTTWDANGVPGSYQNTSSYNSFSTVTPSTGSTTVGGTSLPNRNSSATNSAACTALNVFPGGNLVGINQSYSGTITTTPTDNDPPVHPAAIQNLSASQNATVTVTGFRYAWSSSSCVLQRASAKNTFNVDRTGTATKPITWTPYNTITAWTYKPMTFNVSSLKAGGSTWNGSVSLPIGQANGASVKLSGSNTTIRIQTLSNTSVTWSGCIEERKTFQNTDGDGSDDWTGYPSSPSDAIDMDIDRAPSAGDDDTRWKPALHSAVWGRQVALDGTTWSGGWTTDWVTSTNPTTSTPGRNLSSNSCVTASRKLAMYNGATGADDFKTYVNTLVPNGNTYHDIGLLWGARLMSPTGIFASENATTPGGAQITRHLIFMTDGDTANTDNNYTSYGIDWWDRRQFNTGASSTQLEANNNARANALCAAIKGKNITLWVISYGNQLTTSTVNRLKACSSGTNYYFSAASTTALVQKFSEIADQIGNLRLTQ
jgi:Flp pilus assembly protein TadG